MLCISHIFTKSFRIVSGLCLTLFWKQMLFIGFRTNYNTYISVTLNANFASMILCRQFVQFLSFPVFFLIHNNTQFDTCSRKKTIWNVAMYSLSSFVWTWRTCENQVQVAYKERMISDKKGKIDVSSYHANLTKMFTTVPSMWLCEQTTEVCACNGLTSWYSQYEQLEQNDQKNIYILLHSTYSGICYKKQN